MINGEVVKNVVKKLLIRFMIILFFLFMWIIGLLSYKNSLDAEHMFRTAKNIQLSMRLLSIQYYGENRNLYAPNNEFGMEEDTLKEIKSLSDADGEITLISWNYQKSVPAKFIYETDSYLVFYEYNSNNDELEWKVCRIHPVIDRGFH